MITQELFNKNLESILKAKPKKIAVAVSGGSDSLALTLLSSFWAKENNVEVVAITVDHNLRKNSAKEALLVNKWLQKYKINHSQDHVWKPQHIRNDKEFTKWNPVIKYCMYDMIAVNRSVLQVTEEQDINDAVNSNHKSMPVFGNKTFQNFTFFGELFHTIPYHNIFILLLQINFLIKYIKIL